MNRSELGRGEVSRNVGRWVIFWPLFLLQFSTGGGKRRPAIWLNAGMHSREWISQATAIWTARKVISSGISQGFWWALGGGLQNPMWLDLVDKVERRSVQTQEAWSANSA